jgi:hypothetical protein
LVVWKPANAGGWDWFDAREWEYCESVGTCLKRTVRGSRAFVYESGSAGAITAVLDFQGSPGEPLRDWGYVAPNVFRPLATPIPRADLSEGVLRNIFGKRGVPRHGQELDPQQASAIVAALRPAVVPPFIAMPVKRCPRPPGEGWLRADIVWGREGPMRDAVVESGEWRKLFRHRPSAERRSAHGFDRYDLVSYQDRVVAEFKLDATAATLNQLDRYLKSLHEWRGGDWTGHIVWGNSCSHTLVEPASHRRNVSIWQCDRRTRRHRTDAPELVPL